MDRVSKARAVLKTRVARFRSSCRSAKVERRLLELAKIFQKMYNNVNVDGDFETIRAKFIESEAGCKAGDEFVINDSSKCDAKSDMPSAPAAPSSAVAHMEVDQFSDPFFEFKRDLKGWILETNVARGSVDSLLKILKGPVPSLPSSYKTFLKPRTVFNIKKYSDGSQFGLESGLKRCINPNSHSDGAILPLQIFLDGLSPYNYSNIQLWPLMGRIYHEPDIYPPFPIACNCGPGKPQDIDDFFAQFIEEYNKLYRTDIVMNGKILKIKIMCIIGDKPARSEALRIKGHASKNACERCNIVPIYFKRKQVFPLLKNCKPRTDQSFRLLQDPNHHYIKPSPLLKLEPHINMVYQVVLEFMHGDCIGEMKKLLCDIWTDPSSGILTKVQIMQLSQRLSLL
ncbi:hypothetical protein QAD02_013983 [Eretmocerus hayati]|uniref:Uncharacterized protein n=1 Tax=Eretmocerus hayati TaxID=131215 RepID=A0ACC2P5A0_9HYME|nr:hypothetical protein QAD02_013983 [Eretmocerus hayati]